MFQPLKYHDKTAMINVLVNPKEILHTHGKDHWISSWWRHSSLNRPERKLRWHHRNTHSRPQMDKSTLLPHTSLHMALHPPRSTQEDRVYDPSKACGVWIVPVSVTALTLLLHSLNRGPVITRHDCSTVTNLTILSLQGAGIYTHTDFVYIYQSIIYKSVISFA